MRIVKLMWPVLDAGRRIDRLEIPDGYQVPVQVDQKTGDMVVDAEAVLRSLAAATRMAPAALQNLAPIDMTCLMLAATSRVSSAGEARKPKRG